MYMGTYMNDIKRDVKLQYALTINRSQPLDQHISYYSPRTSSNHLYSHTDKHQQISFVLETHCDPKHYFTKTSQYFSISIFTFYCIYYICVLLKQWKIPKVTYFTPFYCRDRTEGKIEASEEPPSLLCKRSTGWKELPKSSLNKGCNYLRASRLFSAP